MSNLNVYSGLNSIQDYCNPDKTPMTPLVELPNHEFVNDKVRIWAKLQSAHPLSNVKAYPALNMLQNAIEKKEILDDQTKEIVEYSSGSTVMSLGVLARQLGINSTQAYLSNKTSLSKIDLLRFFGLELTFFPGPSQPLPDDIYGGIYHAHKRGKQYDSFNPDQYANQDNPNAHVRWTSKQILAQKPDINVFCAGMGTSGTMTGTGSALKQTLPNIVNVGVCTQAGDRVPGPRALSMLQPVTWYNWRDVIDTVEEVGSKDSYELSLWLSRHGILAGPSSGFNLKGLYNYLERSKSNNELDQLRSDDGYINCVFICCDLPYIYLNEYKQKLGESYFAPMHNSELLGVDLYPYLDSWELLSSEGIALLNNVHKPLKILDLRSKDLFNQYRIPNSVNVPLLQDLYPNCTPNPFLNASEMARQWPILNDGLVSHAIIEEIKNEKLNVLCICEHGGVSRSATSILRKIGIESVCIKGGINAWINDGNVIERISNVNNENDKQPCSKSSTSSISTKSLVLNNNNHNNVDNINKSSRKFSTSRKFSYFIRKARLSFVSKN